MVLLIMVLLFASEIENGDCFPKPTTEAEIESQSHGNYIDQIEYCNFDSVLPQSVFQKIAENNLSITVKRKRSRFVAKKMGFLTKSDFAMSY